MQQHLGRSRSLSNLLRTMEHDGMIEREVFPTTPPAGPEGAPPASDYPPEIALLQGAA